MSDVVVVCPFFYCSHPQRAEITRRVFRHYAKGDFTFLGIGAEGDLSRDLFCEIFPEDQYREYTVPIPDPGSSGNAELHAKSMYAFDEAREYNPKYVFHVGSDDVAPLEFFKPFDADFRGFAQGEDGGFYMWHHGTSDYAWVPGDYDHYPPWHDVKICAAILGWKATLLDDFGWRFVFDHGEIGIERDIRAAGYEVEEVRGMAPWIVKCDAQLNPWELWSHTRQFVSREKSDEFQKYWRSLDGR